MVPTKEQIQQYLKLIQKDEAIKKLNNKIKNYKHIYKNWKVNNMSLFCKHNYKLEAKTLIYGKDNDLPIKVVRIYICQKCGKVKKIKTQVKLWMQKSY